MMAPTISPQNAPLMPSKVMPLAVMAKVKAGASSWVSASKLALIARIKAGISARPANPVIKPAGAMLAMVATNAANRPKLA